MVLVKLGGTPWTGGVNLPLGREESVLHRFQASGYRQGNIL